MHNMEKIKAQNCAYELAEWRGVARESWCEHLVQLRATRPVASRRFPPRLCLRRLKPDLRAGKLFYLSLISLVSGARVPISGATKSYYLMYRYTFLHNFKGVVVYFGHRSSLTVVNYPICCESDPWNWIKLGSRCLLVSIWLVSVWL